MKFCRNKAWGERGSSLIEAVVAVGVLAVAVPLVFATLAGSGESGAAARAETRCSWIVPACVEELQATRTGEARFLPDTVAGEAFPKGGEVMALGFSDEGRPLGRVVGDSYEKGLKILNGEPVRYIAVMTGEPVKGTGGDADPLLAVRVRLEYPAAVPAAKRSKLDFHTRMP